MSVRPALHAAFLAAAAVFVGTAAGQVAPRPADSALTLGAVLQLALQQNPNVLLNKQQVESARGSAMQALGGFDTVTEFSANRTRSRVALTPAEKAQLAAVAIDDVTRHDGTQSTTRLSLQKPLQNGLTLGSDYTVQRNADALQALQPGVLGLSQSTGRLSFSIQVPLLRNAGRDVTGAAADAAERELAASVASLEFASSQTMLTATLYYWDYVARQHLLELALESEARTGRLLEEMRKLAAADQIPQADLELVLASSAERTAHRLAAQHALSGSRRSLARHLGLDRAEELSIKRPATPFPVADQGAAAVATMLGERVAAAESLRADLRAAELREQSARLLQGAAQHNLKPLANLNFSISNGGLALGASSMQLGSPYTSSQTGPTLTLGLQVQWPAENQQARGLVLARSASAVGAEITRRDLQASIGSGIQLAAGALNAGVAQLEAAALAVRHYSKSLDNEQTRRRMGAGTLMDVINLEDRLNGALQTEVQVRQAFAGAIAQLLFETGRIIRKRSETEFEVPLDALLKLTTETAGMAKR